MSREKVSKKMLSEPYLEKVLDKYTESITTTAIIDRGQG